MKILHVVESLIGGPASYLEEMLPHQTTQFGRTNIILLIPKAGRQYLAGSIDCEIETYRRTGRNLLSVVTLAFALRRAIKARRPDIVHLHSSIAGAVGRVVIRAMLSPVFVVYCAHCWSFDRPRPTAAIRLWAFVERALSGLADVIVNLSPHEEALLQRAGFSSANIRLIISGMNDLAPSSLPSTPRPWSPGAPLRLLFAGRLDVQKGIDLLLHEYAGLQPGCVHLRVVGAKIVNTGNIAVPAGVELTGWVPHEALPALLADVDALVMPSRWEGMPLLAIEALRSGRPVIGSKHGPFPFFIEHGVNGALVDINTPGWLTEAIAVIQNADLVAMGKAARATYVAMFAQPRMSNELATIYTGLVGQPPLGASRTAAQRTPSLAAPPSDASTSAGEAQS